MIKTIKRNSYFISEVIRQKDKFKNLKLFIPTISTKYI